MAGIELAGLVEKLANYLESATGIIETDACGDEDDVSDARALIAEARRVIGKTPV
jgi:hypothetical protein